MQANKNYIKRLKKAQKSNITRETFWLYPEQKKMIGEIQKLYKKNGHNSSRSKIVRVAIESMSKSVSRYLVESVTKK